MTDKIKFCPQVNLTSKVTCLDELIRFHTKYINRVVFRFNIIN